MGYKHTLYGFYQHVTVTHVLIGTGVENIAIYLCKNLEGFYSSIKTRASKSED